jgi:hypothetical protein
VPAGPSSLPHNHQPYYPDPRFILDPHQNVSFVRQPVASPQHQFPAAAAHHYQYTAAYQASFPPFLQQQHQQLQQQQQQKFYCFLCSMVFDQQASLLAHMTLHQQQQHLSQNSTTASRAAVLPAAAHQAVAAAVSQQKQQKRPRGVHAHGPECSCGCRRQVANSSKKAKRMEEDIDAETLKQISALEWERKHG